MFVQALPLPRTPKLKRIFRDQFGLIFELQLNTTRFSLPTLTDSLSYFLAKAGTIDYTEFIGVERQPEKVSGLPEIERSI